MQISIYKNYQEVSTFWNTNLPTNHHLQLQDLAVVQDAMINNVQPLYIIVKQNGVLQMQVYAQLLTFSSSFISNDNLNSFYKLLSKMAVNCMQFKLLVIGHLFRHDGLYYYFSPEIKDKQQFFVKVIDEIQKQINHNAIFLKDLPNWLSLPFKINTRYQAFDNDVSMQLQIPKTWNTILDYENELTKKYAKRMRTTQKHFKDVEIKELLLNDVEKYSDVIYNLYLQVAKHQTITFGLLNKNYFPIFKKQMGDNLKMYGYFLNEKMIAFSSAIVHDDVYDMNYIGFDYSENTKLSLYFNMLFCCIQNAIANKSCRLVLGRTALEAKAILGCKPVPIMGYYKINNLFFSAITKQFTKRTAKEQGNLWMNRHPFKELGNTNEE